MPSQPEPPETAEAGEPARGKGIVANTLFGMLAQVTTAGFTLVLTLFLVRALGPDGYGLFSLAISIGAIGLMLADFGLSTSSSRFIAERLDDRLHLRRVFGTTLRLKLTAALVVSGLLFLLAPVLASAFGTGLTWPIRAVAVSLVFETMIMQSITSFGALRRVDYNARTQVFESLTETTASIALVLVGTGATGALFGRAAGYAVGTVVGLVLLAHLIGRPRMDRDAESRELTRSIVDYAKPLLLINGVYTLYSYTDILLVGALLDETAAAEFAAPARLVGFVGYVGTSIGMAVAPRLAGETPNVEAFTRGLRIITLLQLLFVVPLLVWATPLVRVGLGSEYRVADQVLRALVPYTFFLGIGPIITVGVTFMGHAKRRVPIVVAALVINVVLDLVLIPAVGVVGAAIGSGVAVTVYIPAHLRVIVRELDLDLRAIGLTFARGLLAAAVAGLLLLVLGTDRLAWWAWPIGAIGTPLIYVAALRLLGELTAQELAAARGWVAGRLGR